MKWALLFGVSMLACAGLFVIAPFCGWWLPDAVSSHGWDIDFLFYIILFITAFFFILTEAILVFFMARYAGEPGQKTGIKEETPNWLKPVTNVLNNQHKIEMAWTLIPAAILLYIAFAQINTWANAKYLSRQEGQYKGEVPVQIAVSARQFEWRMRYPGVQRMKSWFEKKDDPDVIKDMKSFAVYEQSSDLHIPNDLHVIKDNPVTAHVSTKDVLHSFNLPQFRVKQDTLPGKQIPVWFKPIRANLDEDNNLIKGREWEIPCAELCGWGHGRMIGRVFVHETPELFFAWLTQLEKEQKGVPTSAK